MKSPPCVVDLVPHEDCVVDCMRGSRGVGVGALSRVRWALGPLAVGALVAGAGEAVEGASCVVKRRRWARSGCSRCAGVASRVAQCRFCLGSSGVDGRGGARQGGPGASCQGRPDVLSVGPFLIDEEAFSVVCIVLVDVCFGIGHFVAHWPRGGGMGLREGMRGRGREDAVIVRVRGANAGPWVVGFAGGRRAAPR